MAENNSRTGNFFINILWRLAVIALMIFGIGHSCTSISEEHYRVVNGSVSHKVTEKGVHFKNFTLLDHNNNEYKFEGKVDKKGKITYYCNGARLENQSQMEPYKLYPSQYHKCNTKNCPRERSKYKDIIDGEILCAHESCLWYILRIVFICFGCAITGITLVGIGRNCINLYHSDESDYYCYDKKTIRSYDYYDDFIGPYIDKRICEYDVVKPIKQFFGY